MEKYHGKTVEYWKQNAEEDYSTTPISVLKYITVLEEQAKQLRKHAVMQRREQLFDFLRWYSDERELNYSDSHILVMIDKYQKSNNCA